MHEYTLASVKSSSSKFNHAKVAKINLSFLGLGRTDDFLMIFCVEKLRFETNPPTTKPLVTVDLKKTPSPLRRLHDQGQKSPASYPIPTGLTQQEDSSKQPKIDRPDGLIMYLAMFVDYGLIMFDDHFLIPFGFVKMCCVFAFVHYSDGLQMCD